MIDRHHPDPAEREPSSPSRTSRSPRSSAATSSAASTDEPPCAHDLLAVAAEFGDTAVDALRTVLACYEAMRATRRRTRRDPSDTPTTRDPRRGLPCRTLTSPPSIRSGSLR